MNDIKINKNLERIEFFNGIVICKCKAATKEDFQKIFGDSSIIIVNKVENNCYKIDIKNYQRRLGCIIHPNEWLLFPAVGDNLEIINDKDVCIFLNNNVYMKISYKI